MLRGGEGEEGGTSDSVGPIYALLQGGESEGDCLVAGGGDEVVGAGEGVGMH